MHRSGPIQRTPHRGPPSRENTVNRLLILVLALVAISACTTTKEFAATDYRRPSGDFKLIVMQPDISVGLLTAGGLVEPREDWTEQARDHVLAALAAHQSASGGEVTVAASLDEAGGDVDTLRDLVSLHNAVGQAIFVHKYFGLKLPTKENAFDWTLGDSAVDYGRASGYDYALFLYAEASFSSAGRQALQVAGWLSCAVGVCVGVAGGQQIAFASLVDLSSGDVTWFNTLASSIGDIRTPEGAEKMVARLLETMEASAGE